MGRTEHPSWEVKVNKKVKSKSKSKRNIKGLERLQYLNKILKRL